MQYASPLYRPEPGDASTRSALDGRGGRVRIEAARGEVADESRGGGEARGGGEPEALGGERLDLADQAGRSLGLELPRCPRRVAMLLDGRPQLLDPLAIGRRGAEHRRGPLPRL